MSEVGEGLLSTFGGVLGSGVSQNLRNDRKIGELQDAFSQVADFQSIQSVAPDLLNSRGQNFAGIGGVDSSLNRLQGLTDFSRGTPIGERLLTLQEKNNLDARNRISAQSQSGLQNSLDSLAARGGLQSGSRERLAAQAGRDSLIAQQEQSNTDQQARLNISAQDAQRQLGILQNLPGQFLQRANFDRQNLQFDTNNKITDLNNANQDAIQRSSALAEAQIQQQNAPKGGIGGVVSGIFGK